MKKLVVAVMIVLMACTTWAGTATLETNAAADVLRITGGTSISPVTFNDVWDWDDGGGSSGGAGDVPKDGGGTAAVSTFMTESVADRLYRIHKDIDFGDNSTATYVRSISEHVYFDDNVDVTIVGSTTAATLCIGDILGDYGIHGSAWSLKPSAIMNWIASSESMATMVVYASQITNRADQVMAFQDGSVTFVQSQFQGENYNNNYNTLLFEAGVDYCKLDDVFLASIKGLDLMVSPDVLEKVHIHRTLSGFLARTSIDVVTDNVLITAGINEATVGSSASVTHTDPLMNVSDIWLVFANSEAVEQYTANVHTTDANGVDLFGVAVKCVDTSSGTEFDVDTDADGLIDEQTVDYKKWVGTGETLTDYSPHQFEFTKWGFADYIVKNVTVDKPIDWAVKMTPNSANAGFVSGGVYDADLDDTGWIEEIDSTTICQTAMGGNSFTIWDITVPDEPSIIGGPLVDNTYLSGAEDMYVDAANDVVYVTSLGYDGITAIDISTPATPVIVTDGYLQDSTYLDGAQCLAVRTYDSGNQLVAWVLALHGDYITTVDITDPTDMTILDSLSDALIDYPIYIKLAGDVGYVASRGAGKLLSIDVSDPTDISISDDITCLQATGIALDTVNDIAYVATPMFDGIYCFDISTPSAMTVVDSVGDGTRMDGARIAELVGDYVLVSGFTSDTIGVIDVSTSTDLTVMSDYVYSADWLDEADDIRWINDRLYVTGRASETLTVVRFPFLED